MKHCRYVLLILLAVCPLAFAQTSEKSIGGVWRGTLEAEGTKLRLVVTITQASAGGYSGTLESVDQEGATIAIDTITVNGDAVKLEIKGIDGVYEGALNKEWSEMTGKWMQGGSSLSLTLKASAPAPK